MKPENSDGMTDLRVTSFRGQLLEDVHRPKTGV